MKIVALLAWLFAIPCTLLAQNDELRFSTIIYYSFGDNIDELSQAGFRSYIERELRSLGYIDIIEEKDMRWGTIGMEVQALRIMDRSGYNYWYVVAPVVVIHTDCGAMYLDAHLATGFEIPKLSGDISVWLDQVVFPKALEYIKDTVARHLDCLVNTDR